MSFENHIIEIAQRIVDELQHDKQTSGKGFIEAKYSTMINDMKRYFKIGLNINI